MHLENYTNINIFKKAFEQRDIPTSNNLVAHADNFSEGGAETSHHSQFNPYTNNNGTTAGKSILVAEIC